MGAKQIQIFSDSQLVVHQVNQDFTAKDVSMTAYLQHTRHLLTTFNAYLIGQVPRSENSHADALARLASAMEQGIGRNIHIEFLDQPSTWAPLICVIDQSPTWMDLITQFLHNQTLPADPAEARRVRYRSARYLIINGALYKRGFSLPHLRCLTPEEAEPLTAMVEAVNKIIKKTLKTKLDKAKGCWPELLPEVLWSYRTTFRTLTGETPFSLSFGTEAVALVEIGQPTYRTSTYEAEANDEQLALNLDFIDELRDQSNMRNVPYKQRIAKHYDSRVKALAFKLGDWVMRKISLATKNPTEGTLGPTWEGPYEVTKVCRPGTYQLRDTKGKTLPHPWNANHLKYYYK
ncbi:unnamed protein product [Prunus armeniaca]